MRPLFCVAGVLLVLLMAGLVSGPVGASSDDETPSIKKVMKTLHNGKNAPLNKLKAALKGDSPDWAAVQKEAKLFATFGAALPKNDPPRGGKASYEKLAKAYALAGKSSGRIGRKRGLEGVARCLQEDLDIVHAMPQEPPAELIKPPDGVAAAT